jgi:hypothetical protein
MEILSNVQNSLQGVENEQVVIFLLKYWEIQVRIVVLNELTQYGRIK